MHHIDLPVNFLNFIKKIDHVNICGDHGWIVIDLQPLLTVEGLEWFSHRFTLPDKCVIFHVKKNDTTTIHIDPEPASFAFNFILGGHGEMQWIDNLDADNYQHNKYPIVFYTQIKNFSVKESWNGRVGLVDITVPHRILTFDEDRYCLSIRPSYPKTFEEACKLV